ncbi:MAG: hypothetical protein QM731_16430 [Chitinophagaceae bacterium]
MNRGVKIPEQVLVFSGFMVFYLCTLASNFSGPHDSIGYLNGIVKGQNLFHPHHLVYHYIAHCWLVVTQAIFPGVKDYFLVESFTAVWGSASMAMVYSFFRNRFSLSVAISIAGTAVTAFTYGVWFYSTNIEVYAPPMFLLLVALYLLTKKEFTKADAWKVFILHVLAILFHQINILFSLVILYKLWQERKRISLAYSVSIYAVMGIVLVGAAYFWVGWIIAGNNNFAAWVKWMEGYAGAGGDGSYWEPLGWATFSHVGIGFAHAFIGGHFVFKLPVVNDYVSNANVVATHSMGDEIYLARHTSSFEAILLTAFAIVLAILMLTLLFRFIFRYRSIRKQYGNTVSLLILSGAIYSIFFCLWDPEILEFWIFQTMLVWLLLIGTLPVTGFPFRIKPLAGVWIIGVLMFIVNYFGSIRWIQDVKNDLYYAMVEPVKDVATPKDVLLLQNGWLLKDFLEYYSKGVVKEIPYIDSARTATDNYITHTLAQGGKVYIYPETGNTSNATNTTYIDSLLKQYGNRQTIFNKESPLIIVIQ